MLRAALALIILVAALPVSAEITLRFDPIDQTIPVGGSGHLSVFTDEAIDLRTIELWVHYNPAILTSIHGSGGDLFADSGCTLFQDFNDNTPGEWYGTAIALGFDCWLTGPGELYRWDFDGLAPGFSHVDAVQVRLYDPDAVVIEDVTLPGTLVFVGSGTDAEPAPGAGLELGLAPNPFNPSCRLSLHGKANGPARLDLFDITGKSLGTIWQGNLNGTLEVNWQGLDARGTALPSGAYLFRLMDASGRQVTTRGLLLK
jgi:hypothetical protein